MAAARGQLIKLEAAKALRLAILPLLLALAGAISDAAAVTRIRADIRYYTSRPRLCLVRQCRDCNNFNNEPGMCSATTPITSEGGGLL